MKDKILKNAFLLGAGGVVCKVIGAVYRVLLTNAIGTVGIGFYQMVFPIYTIMLTFSSTGVPTAISKLIAEGKNAKKVLYKSIIAFFIIGIVGVLLIIFLSKPLSKLQGNEEIYKLYLAIAPSVAIVSLISCYRGYHQGKLNVLPTAFSQIIEQIVKVVCGLTFSFAFGKTAIEKAFFATLAVTISEMVALIVILAFKRKDVEGESLEVKYKTILKVSIPITLTSILLPLSHSIDSYLLINLYPLSVDKATSLFGIYTGVVESLIQLPVSVCYAFSVIAVPIIAKNKNDNKNRTRILIYTLISSLIFAILTFVFANFIIEFLYKSMPYDDKAVAKQLLKISSVSIVLLSMLQSMNAMLFAKDRLFLPSFFLFLGLIVKIILTFILAPSPRFYVISNAICDISCFFVATFCNLLYIIRERKNKFKSKTLGVG